MWDGRRIVALAAVAATAGVVWLVASKVEQSPEPAAPEIRGEMTPPPDRPGTEERTVPAGLDFGQPDQVARAYLVAAHSLRDSDRDRTNRRVLPYLAPDNPAHPRGIVVADAPPPGQAVTAAVTDLRVARTNEAGSIIVYEARLALRAGTATANRTTFVVLGRQPDGRWLVRRETAYLQPGD